MNNNEQLRKIPPTVLPAVKVVIPEAKSFTLDNGVPVYLIESGTEDIMRLEFTFRAGQVKEYLPLLASTTNQMLSEGSLNYTSEELNRQLDYYGAFMNLTPEKDRAGLVIFFLSKHIEKILDLSYEILFRPVFPEPELRSLMNKRSRWFQVRREKVSNVAIDRLFESIFGKRHPYGRQIEPADFENLNPEIIRDFHSRHYTSDNMSVIVSGKLHSRTTELLNHYFGAIMPVDISKDGPDNKILSQKRKKIHIHKPDTVQSAIRIGSATINKRHPDYTGVKILDAVLGGYFGSRLMKNIREEKGYTYGISSSVSSLDHSGYKVISTEVGHNNLQKAIDEIYKEIILLQNVPIENTEMTVIRNYLSGEMVRMFDGPFAQAESFKSAWEFGLDNNYYYRLSKKISEIDSDEIIDLARTYYNIDDLYQVTVGSK